MDNRKFYTELITSVLNGIEKGMGYNPDDDIDELLVKVLPNLPKAGSKEDLERRALLEKFLFALFQVFFVASFNNVALLEFNKRKTYNLELKEFLNFLYDLQDNQSRRKYDDQDFIKIETSMNESRKEDNTTYLLDRMVTILLVLNAYRQFDQVGLIALMIYYQLNVYLKGR